MEEVQVQAAESSGDKQKRKWNLRELCGHSFITDVLVLRAVEPRCRAQLYPDPTPGWQVDAKQLFGFPWKKTQSAAGRESWACSAQVSNKAPACIQVWNGHCFEGLKYYEKFQCKHSINIELKLPAPAFRWPQGIRSKAPFCQPLVLLFFSPSFQTQLLLYLPKSPGCCSFPEKSLFCLATSININIVTVPVLWTFSNKPLLWLQTWNSY